MSVVNIISLAGAGTSIIFVVTNVLLQQTCVFTIKVCLSGQKFCRDKHFLS